MSFVGGEFSRKQDRVIFIRPEDKASGTKMHLSINRDQEGSDDEYS